MSSLVCWKCGASLADLSLPLQRLDECRQCGAQLHVCKLCQFYSPAVAKQCRETIADEVKEKERANFCGYFDPRPDAWSAAGQSGAARARGELEALFGAPEAQGEAGTSAADRARIELERLFRKD